MISSSAVLPVIFLAHTPEMRKSYYRSRALDDLRTLGTVMLHEGDTALDAAGLIASARQAAIIVADRMTAGPSEIFAAMPGLVAFVRVAVDIRNIDLEAASAAGVLVTHAGPGFVDSVTELTLGFMIDLSRGISRSVRAYQNGMIPSIQMGQQLAGSTLGIIGFGSIGRRLAPLGAALGMKVLVADPYATVPPGPISHVDLETLLAESDYMVCLATATSATENLLDAAAFARMKPGAFFVNMSRGDLVDEAALESALRGGRIGGVALDVGRGTDQMPSPHIAGLPNVIATPHVGGLTVPAIEHQALETVRQVAAIINSEAPQGSVNPESWSRRALLVRRKK